MKRQQVRERIQQIGIIPSIRVSSPQDAIFAAETLAHSGIPVVEVTMTVPGALDVIAELARNRPEIIAGAGTVLDLETARRCLDAGAKFLTSPGLDLEAGRTGFRKGVSVLGRRRAGVSSRAQRAIPPHSTDRVGGSEPAHRAGVSRSRRSGPGDRRRVNSTRSHPPASGALDRRTGAPIRFDGQGSAWKQRPVTEP